jgi:hypothetical protein
MINSTVESLMENKAITNIGWIKDDNDNRIIRIGNVMNCNNDGLICDKSIKQKMINLMNKFNIINYEIENIHTKYEYSFELRIKEKDYISFVNKLKI